ncbi:hypothetical protein Tco_1161059, partial [Tanacetum coccineum]
TFNMFSVITPIRELEDRNEKFWISSDSDPVNWLFDASKIPNVVADVDKLFRKSERFPSNLLPEIKRLLSFLPNNGHNQLYMVYHIHSAVTNPFNLPTIVEDEVVLEEEDVADQAIFNAIIAKSMGT